MVWEPLEKQEDLIAPLQRRISLILHAVADFALG